VSQRLAGPARPSVKDRILVVDDDRRSASGRAEWLCSQGFHASAVGCVAEAAAVLGRTSCGLCIVDGGLPDGGADRLRRLAPAAAFVVTVPAGLPPAACPGTVAADAVVALPASDADLLAAIEQARSAAGRRAPAACGPTVLGDHPSMRRILELVARVAATPATVLVTGESGTGKSLVARAIHEASGRPGRFVEVACGALSETLLDSELFGHVAGAFTGATGDREGRFRQADRGTIFLDEIATASPAMQVKLLRVLQEGRFEPVGGTETRAIDARVILATHEPLERLVAEGSFRADLYWRINVVTIEMPPLRDRAADIPALARHFLRSAAARAGRPVEDFTPAAVDALVGHAWPGNVRELEHAVERAVFLGTGRLVDIHDLPPAVVARQVPAFARRGAPPAAGDGGDAASAGALKQALAVPERRLIIDALERSGWRRDEAARVLGINRTTLYRKLKRLGLSLADVEPTR